MRKCPYCEGELDILWPPENEWEGGKIMLICKKCRRIVNSEGILARQCLSCGEFDLPIIRPCPVCHGTEFAVIWVKEEKEG